MASCPTALSMGWCRLLPLFLHEVTDVLQSGFDAVECWLVACFYRVSVHPASEVCECVCGAEVANETLEIADGCDIYWAITVP